VTMCVPGAGDDVDFGRPAGGGEDVARGEQVGGGDAGGAPQLDPFAEASRYRRHDDRELAAPGCTQALTQPTLIRCGVIMHQARAMIRLRVGGQRNSAANPPARPSRSPPARRGRDLPR
jgi:hypothetical protein